jgi:uncharacterized protein
MESDMKNLVTYFEIPVNDLERAIKFYSVVFGCDFECLEIDGNDMAYFPAFADAPGITGALAKGESYVPSRQGSRLYFSSADIDESLRRVELAGGQTVYAKTSIGELGWVAEFEDSEGNCIALSQAS